MSHGKLALVVVLALTGCLMGCRTTGDALADKASGTVEVYPVSTDQAWEISRTVFRWEGCDAIEEHRTEGYMITTSGMSLGTYGTVMAAWVEPAGSESKVTVVTKRRVATNFITTLTEGTFHRRFGQAVEIVKDGKPLPTAAPGG